MGQRRPVICYLAIQFFFLLGIVAQNDNSTGDREIYALDGYTDAFDANSSTLGFKPVRPPDLLICDTFYGTDLPPRIGGPCDKAFQKLPSGDRFATYVTQKSYPMSTELKVPFYYTDLEEGSTQTPRCTITIDLAGRSLKDNKVTVRHNTLRDLVRSINSTCLDLNSERGGFATYHIGKTVEGIAQYKVEPAGYNAPVFLTAQISRLGSRKRPGNTDPRVGERIQDELERRIRQAYTRYNKQKLMVLVNSLIETRRRMRLGGDQSWWDTRHIPANIPQNVQYTCMQNWGMPTARDCEDISFFYIGDRAIVVEPRTPITRQVGDCAIRIRARERHMCSMDTLRATIDVMISTCLDGPGAPGTGVQAAAQPLSGPSPVNGTPVGAVTPLPVVLPPTYLLQMGYRQPGLQACIPYKDPVYGNDTGFCLDTPSVGPDFGSASNTSSTPANSTSPQAPSETGPSVSVVQSGLPVFSAIVQPIIADGNVLTSRDRAEEAEGAQVGEPVGTVGD